MADLNPNANANLVPSNQGGQENGAGAAGGAVQGPGPSAAGAVQVQGTSAAGSAPSAAPPQYAPAVQYAHAVQYTPGTTGVPQYAPAIQYTPGPTGAPQYAPAAQYAPGPCGAPQYAPTVQYSPGPSGAPQYGPVQYAPGPSAAPQFAPAVHYPPGPSSAGQYAPGPSGAVPYAPRYPGGSVQYGGPSATAGPSGQGQQTPGAQGVATRLLYHWTQDIPQAGASATTPWQFKSGDAAVQSKGPLAQIAWERAPDQCANCLEIKDHCRMFEPCGHMPYCLQCVKEIAKSHNGRVWCPLDNAGPQVRTVEVKKWRARQ